MKTNDVIREKRAQHHSLLFSPLRPLPSTRASSRPTLPLLDRSVTAFKPPYFVEVDEEQATRNCSPGAHTRPFSLIPLSRAALASPHPIPHTHKPCLSNWAS
jgi:hypothetical protein